MTDQRSPPPPKDAPAFSPQQAAEFMQKLWNPFGVPMPGFGLPGTAGAAPAGPGGAPMPFPNAAMMFAALDPAEVERKISELRVVENWLGMSLSMMQMSIKGLELQKAALEAMQPSAPPQSPKNR